MSDDAKRMIAIFTVLILIVVVVFGFLYNQKRNLDTMALPAIVPNSDISPTFGPDPAVPTWKTYPIPQYRTSINIPADWNIQDYAQLHPFGGTLIAFSPAELPCSSCSYIRNGYASLRIFSEKTDPEYYALYLGRIQQLGHNKTYQEIKVGEKTGLLTGNTVAVEHSGWIYELTLDKNDGKATLDDSSIFTQMVNSLTFAEDLLDLK
jgi:hypothetical protein